MFGITQNQARAVLVAVASVVAFLLVQQDVPLDPIVRLTLGAIAVFLAAINGPATLAGRQPVIEGQVVAVKEVKPLEGGDDGGAAPPG